MTGVSPAEPPAGWTAPPPAVRVAGSHRVHAASVMLAGRVIFPACGVSLGRPVRRIPVADPTLIDCPACHRLTATAEQESRP